MTELALFARAKPQPLARACSDGYSRIDLVEKAHLHVRFIFSKSETQKRPQRASQTLNCGRLRTRAMMISAERMASQSLLRRALQPFLRFSHAGDKPHM